MSRTMGSGLLNRAARFGRLPWILAAGILRSVGAEPVLFTHSRSFDLGPGETAFNLAFPQFDLAGHPGIEALEEVRITLEATFRAGAMLHSSAAAGVAATWSLGQARVEAIPRGSGLSLRPALEAALSGSIFVPAQSDVVVSPAPSVQVVSTVKALPPDVGAFLGTGTFAYDVDFAGQYHQVATAPASVTGLYASDRITGQLTVTYWASSRDAAPVILIHFGAQRAASGRVVVNWETGSENGVPGFHLERQDTRGVWMRLTPRLLPALGSTHQPAWYRFEDPAAPGDPDLRYRLVVVDRDGTSRLGGETGVRPGLEAGIRIGNGAIELVLTGPSGALVAVERSDHLPSGGWTSFWQTALDAQGRAVVPLGAPVGALSYYRARWR